MYDRNEACPRMLRYKPPRIAMTLLLLAAAAQLLRPATWVSVPASLAGGTLIATLGFGIMLRAWWLFRRYQTAICPTAETTSLLTHDVYGLTRNPMYLGIVLMLLGLAIAAGWVLFYAAALVFFFIIDYVFCPYEEARLARKFGNTFNRYRERVRRWL